MPEVSALLNGGEGSCCLHIVIEDCNIRDSDIEFCVKLAREKNCKHCEQIGRMIYTMTSTQRRKLLSF